MLLYFHNDWMRARLKFYKAVGYIGVTRYTIRSTWKSRPYHVYARTLSMMEFE